MTSPGRVHESLDAAAGRLQGGAMAIGNFDGVHLGHQALFAAVRRDAHGPAAALTFEPHPARLLAPQYAPPLICARPRKRELIAACGISDLIEQPFDKEFASTLPERFVEKIAATGIAEVVVGHDFTYGKARAGTVATLRESLARRGLRLHEVAPVTVNGLVCSSTKVREFVLEGRVDAAEMILGRPFDLDGEVVQGAGRGRKLGWPTANIRTTNELLPAVGVYAVRARLLPGGAAIGGAANLGLNPTFRPQVALAGAAGQPPLSLEVHLLDFSEDIYGKRMRVEFIRRLREERRFPNVESLKAQITQDVMQARELLSV